MLYDVSSVKIKARMSWPWAAPLQDGRRPPPPNFAAPPLPNFLAAPNSQPPPQYSAPAQQPFVPNFGSFPQHHPNQIYAQYAPFPHSQSAAYPQVYAQMQPQLYAQPPIHHQMALHQQPVTWASNGINVPAEAHIPANMHSNVQNQMVQTGRSRERHAHGGVRKRVHPGKQAPENRRGGDGGGAARGVERELAHARSVLASLGRKLPGDDADEIADGYASDSSDSVDEKDGKRTNATGKRAKGIHSGTGVTVPAHARGPCLSVVAHLFSRSSSAVTLIRSVTFSFKLSDTFSAVKTPPQPVLDRVNACDGHQIE
eukprot:IDg12205t1